MTLMQKEILQSPDVIKKVLDTNMDTSFHIAEGIAKKTNIFIAARGTSDHAAIYGKYVLENMLGKPVGLAAPSVSTVFSRDVDYSDSVFFGISQSGEAEDVKLVLQSAKKSGAYTVAITNNENSALANAAHEHINLCAGAEKSVAATKTFTASLFAMAMLGAVYAKDDNLLASLELVPEELQKVLVLDSYIKDISQRYRFMESCFTLSRGYDYSIAFEAALKMQECAYVKAKAYSMSDFLHGPIAMIENNTPCFAYLGKGRFSGDMKDILSRIKKGGADITVFSDDDDLLCMSDVKIKLPKIIHEILAPIYIAPAAQLFACYLSLTKGLSPDTPRGLSKVTITV